MMVDRSEATAGITRIDRMRKLSAMLDDSIDDQDAELEALAQELAARRAQEEARWEQTQRGLGESEDDAAMDAVLAQTRRNEFVCVECVAHAAEVFCEQCHDYFCELCYGGQHRKGGRRKHTFQPIVREETTKTDSSIDATGTTKMDVEDEEEEDEESDDASESDDLDDDEDDEDDEDDDHFASAYGATRQREPKKLTHAPASVTSASGSVQAAQAQSTVIERAKYIPVRLTYEERKLLRTLEAALAVSHYTNKLDSPAYLAPAKRLRTQLQEICGFLSGIVVALSYQDGQEVLEDKNFVEKKQLFQEIFELGRRYKIMNPEKLRGEYGKLMYLLQDATSAEIQELLGFSCHKKIHTVYDVLEQADALGVLRHPKIETATMVVAPEGKSRYQIQLLIKAKEQAIREISDRYQNSKINRDGIQQCLYSIADNNYHLYFERDPIDRMIELLTTHFKPDCEDDGYSLAIVSGQDGARLSHSHKRQYNYVLQSLTLWREIAHDMFRLWCLTDEDLLDGTPYNLSDTGQGLHRIQQAPRVSRAMHVILHMTQRKLDTWVGSSVIHLGDKNVPNALMFIDKYTQVGHILRPIVKTVDSIDKLVESSNRLQRYIDSTFGGAKKLKQDILTDFFREAFDGSGADNFFEAGSCIDGRLTSAWNWCSNLHEKPFYSVFKLAGFVGFDGKFG